MTAIALTAVGLVRQAGSMGFHAPGDRRPVCLCGLRHPSRHLFAHVYDGDALYWGAFGPWGA
jgi:hypothetical protein